MTEVKAEHVQLLKGIGKLVISKQRPGGVPQFPRLEIMHMLGSKVHPRSAPGGVSISLSVARKAALPASNPARCRSAAIAGPAYASADGLTANLKSCPWAAFARPAYSSAAAKGRVRGEMG